MHAVDRVDRTSNMWCSYNSAFLVDALRAWEGEGHMVNSVNTGRTASASLTKVNGSK